MFIKKREKEIKNLNLKFQEFEHKCGTKHYHFATKDIENSFLIAFPTFPQTSDGRAHILEHLALCGSEKFNTHDPFFAMTRRSLASFMNAMTYPEKTVYPFSTSDKKDYFNLMSVYLDATFFPKLDYYNFLQEGWRYEYNEKGELEYAGVVYNEMKGALSDKYYHVYRSLQRELKPGTIYCNESGGDPSDIPNLQYKELVSFHDEFYHPSRATIMTYGDIDVTEIQDFFEKEVISKIKTKFDRVQPQSSKFDKNQKIVVKQHYFPSSKDDKDTEYMLLINWLLGVYEDSLTEDYKILSHILLSDGGKLCNEIDNSGFGRPSVFNGTMSGYESSFHLGFEGLKKNEIEKAKKYLLDILQDVADNGVDKKVIDAALDDIELDIKNLNSNSIPYGLKILLKGVEHAVNEKDPLFGVDFEEKFEAARRRFGNKDYVKELAQKLLNDMPQIIIEFVPKPDFFDLKNKAEKDKLVAINNKLTIEEKEKIKADSQKLKEKQTQKHNYDCLPKIESSNVSTKIKKDLKVKYLTDDGAVSYYKIPANGISNIDFMFNLKDFDEKDWSKLQLLATLLPGMPSKTKSWKSATKHRNILSKNLEIQLNAFNSIDNPHAGKLLMEFSISHLERKNKNILKLAHELFFNIGFTSLPRIKQIVKQEIADFEQNLAHIGNDFAKDSVAKEFSFTGRFDHQTTGIEYLKYLKAVYVCLAKKETREAFLSDMKETYEKVIGSPVILLGAGSSKVEKLVLKAYQGLGLNWSKSSNLESKVLEFEAKNIKEAYVADTEVNYCHQGFEIKDVNFREAKSTCLDLAARLMTHNYLHPVIREQNGAYGAGAKFNIFENMFGFYSYRDPNFEKTYNAFEKIHDWFINHEFTEDQLEEAKLSLLQVLEKPMTPKNEYNKNVVYRLVGITEQDRLNRKKFILNATLKDVIKAYKECVDLEKTAKSAFLSKNIKNKFDFEFKKIK